MSEIPSQVNINGPVSGQIAVGNYINQFQNLNGCTIHITSPQQGPVWERKPKAGSGKPRPPSLFLDRVVETRLVEDAIQAFEPVLVSGMAGIGKSTLLKQLIHLVPPQHFTDGIHHLHAYHLAMEDLLQNLFSLFYASNPPAKPNRAQLQEALRDIRALLVIDDIDLNLDEMQVVLDMAPSCMFLIASTQQILQSGLKNVRLGGLPDSDAVMLFETILQRTLHETEKQVVCEISAMLNGHPESLYWLAATTREDRLTPAQVLEKMRAMPVQELFQDSVQSLPDREKKVLAVLTAIGSQPLPQVHLAALLPGEPIRTAVSNLTARGLVQSENQALRLRESFAGALNQSWTLTQWEQAVTRYFVNWLAQRPSWQAIADVRETLWTLMEKSAQRRDWSSVIQLGRALEPFFIVSGYWQAWYVLLQHILGAARHLADSHLEGWVLHQLGSRALCLGVRDQASSLLQQAAAIRKSIGDQAGLQITQHNLSLLPGIVPVTGAAAVAAAAGTTPLIVAATSIASVMAIGASIAALIIFYPPEPPALLQPPPGFVQPAEQYPAFEWQDALAGSTYQIQVDDQADFSSPVYDQTTPGTQLAPSLPLPQGVYYWHVRGLNRTDRPGNWGEVRPFTVSLPPGAPTLLQPLDQFVNTNPAPFSFLWNPAQNATSYQIQIDDSPDFSSPVQDSSVPGTQYAPASTLPRGTYFWHVRAANALNAYGEWSSAWTFSISITPGHIQLLEPTNGSKLETTTTPGFRWQTVENAAEYEIQVDDNPDFSSPQYDARQSGNSFPLQTPLTQASYTWRVRAFNQDGRPGDWSEAWSFVISIPPAIPALTGPANNSVQDLTNMAPLTWTVVINAANYELQVDDSGNFDSLNFSTRSRDPAFRLPATFGQGAYFWRVRALNVYGTAGGWSTPWKLTIIAPPAAPALLSPASGSQFDLASPITFTWQAVQNASQYQIQADNTADFSSPEYQTSTTGTTVTSTQSWQTDLYSWRVRAINSSGFAGSWSAVWNFIVILPAPDLMFPGNYSTVFVLTSDGTGTPGIILRQSAPPYFTWGTVPRAGSYQLLTDDNPNFSSAQVNDTTGNNMEIDGSLATREIPCGQSLDFPTYWKVRALDQNGAPGIWSPAWNVVVRIMKYCTPTPAPIPTLTPSTPAGLQ